MPPVATASHPQGVWQGATVAVKFMLVDSAANVDAAALEGVVSSAVRKGQGAGSSPRSPWSQSCGEER